MCYFQCVFDTVYPSDIYYMYITCILQHFLLTSFLQSEENKPLITILYNGRLATREVGGFQLSFILTFCLFALLCLIILPFIEP